MPLLRRQALPLKLDLRDGQKASDAQNNDLDSAKSPGSPESLDSPKPTASFAGKAEDSPSPTSSSFPSSTLAPKSTDPPKRLPPPSSIATTESSSSDAAKEAPAPSTTATAATSISSQDRPEASSAAPSTPEKAASSTVIIVSKTAAPSTTSIPSASEDSGGTSVAQESQQPTTTSQARAQESSASTSDNHQLATPIASVTAPTVTAQPDREATPTKQPPMPMWAEGILIAVAALGAIALIIFLIIWIKRRKRRNQATLRFSRINDDLSSLSTHDYDDNAPALPAPTHNMTQASTFGTSPLYAPVSMATTRTAPNSQSDRHMRHVPIQTPLPSANPFADPSQNKAYDVLRGRPRSTTLTDRGSWVKNPFKDPSSERFDPFGTLEDQAREERRRYREEVRRQQEMQRGRQESEVTVEGLGVLDRSGGSGSN